MSAMNLSNLLAILDRFDLVNLPYTVSRSQDDDLLVTVVTPGRIWEVTVEVNGKIDVVEYTARFDDIRTGLPAIERILDFWGDD